MIRLCRRRAAAAIAAVRTVLPSSEATHPVPSHPPEPPSNVALVNRRRRRQRRRRSRSLTREVSAAAVEDLSLKVPPCSARWCAKSVCVLASFANDPPN